MKKVLINLALILIGFVIYFLQANFFSWFSIGGIRPNLFVIYILFIGLFGNRSMGIVYGAVWGIFLDLIYKTNVGITVMFMVFGTTIIFEVITYFITYMLYSINVEVLSFIKILIVEIIYNILVTIIIYPLMQKFGYYMENEYKGNKILTRYF